MLTREQLTTDKIYKNKGSNWFAKIVYISAVNIVFQYAQDLEDLLSGIANEDCGPLKEFCENFGIYDPPKIPETITLYRYLVKYDGGGYMLSTWNSMRLKITETHIKEFIKEIKIKE